MCVFSGWENHALRLKENWNNLVKEDDTVVIAGDVSWGMSLQEALPDLQFIENELSGSKILIKGNHDYWWSTTSKIQQFFFDNSISSIQLLHNNSYKVEGVSICGTRGYDFENEKIMKREAGRLEKSILSAKFAESDSEIIVLTHYPPIYSNQENRYIIEVLEKYSIKRVFSGHIHSSGMEYAFVGEKYGIDFDMITSDSIGFTPQKIL